MQKPINLYWFKYSKGKGNFGDELNPYIISKLTNLPFRYINANLVNDNKLLAFRKIFYLLRHRMIGLKEFKAYFIYNFISRPTVFLCIGSILKHCEYRKALVWGSGIISSQSVVPKGKYLAVRGEKTQERLQNLGLPRAKAIGDPAILLPKIYEPKQTKKHKLGIIPHVAHYEKVAMQFNKEEIIVIDLLGDIEEIIDNIRACDFTISTSLHGIIVSHTYGVKSIWSTLSSINLAGDNIKFADYFSSVNIDLYNPIEMSSLKQMSAEKIIEKIQSEYLGYLLPRYSTINEIQNNLLEVFPFPLKKKFKNLIKE